MGFDWKQFFIDSGIQTGLTAIYAVLNEKGTATYNKWLPTLLHAADLIYIAAGLTPPQHP